MKIDLYKCIYRWVLCSMFWGRAAELDLKPTGFGPIIF